MHWTDVVTAISAAVVALGAFGWIVRALLNSARKTIKQAAHEASVVEFQIVANEVKSNLTELGKETVRAADADQRLQYAHIGSAVGLLILFIIHEFKEHRSATN